MKKLGLLLTLISGNISACEVYKDWTVEKVLKTNEAIPSISYFESYAAATMKKPAIRLKYCGERLDSKACFEKLMALPTPDLIKIQELVGHEEKLIHEKSGKADVEEFLLKEFSDPSNLFEDRQYADRQRVPVMIYQMHHKHQFLNMTAATCQENLKYEKGKLMYQKLEVKSSPELLEFMRKVKFENKDFYYAFDEVVTKFDTSKLASEFLSLCVENTDKACVLGRGAEPDACNLQRTIMMSAVRYSQYSFQMAYFEASRPDGHRLYSSTGEKLMNKLVLQPQEKVEEFNRRSDADENCVPQTQKF